MATITAEQIDKSLEAINQLTEQEALKLSTDPAMLRTLKRSIMADFIGSIIAEIGIDQTIGMIDNLKTDAVEAYKQSLS